MLCANNEPTAYPTGWLAGLTVVDRACLDITVDDRGHNVN